MKDGSKESAQSRTELTCVAGHGRAPGCAERTPTRPSLLQESLGVGPTRLAMPVLAVFSEKLACSAWQRSAGAAAVVGAEISGGVRMEAEKWRFQAFRGVVQARQVNIAESFVC